MIAATILLLGATLAQSATDWKYTPDDAARGDHFYASAILSDAPPTDVKVEIPWRGVRRHFGQVRYGDPGSIRVAVAVDELADGNAVLYVDAHRTRVLDAKSALPGAGPGWTTTLEAEHAGRTAERSVYFRWGKHAKVLGVATLGGVTGRVEFGGRIVVARLVDGDGNGLFSDRLDVVQVDLDGDGDFNPFTERFRLRPLMTFGKDRWVARTEPLAGKLTFAPLAGLGKIKLQLPANLMGKAKDVIAVLGSADGVSVTLDRDGAEVETPPGAYSVLSLSFALAGADGKKWNYVFYSDFNAKAVPSQTVGVGRTLACDPLGHLTFGLACRADAHAVRPGQTLEFLTEWKSATGLRVNTVYWGETNSDNSQPHAEIELRDSAGTNLGRDRSGFF